MKFRKNLQLLISALGEPAHELRFIDLRLAEAKGLTGFTFDKEGDLFVLGFCASPGMGREPFISRYRGLDADFYSVDEVVSAFGFTLVATCGRAINFRKVPAMPYGVLMCAIAGVRCKDIAAAKTDEDFRNLFAAATRDMRASVKAEYTRRAKQMPT